MLPSLLINYILVAMISWVPIEDHIYESKEVTLTRYQDIATTIAETALTHSPLFEGEDGVTKTALLLASVASSEGFFRSDVDTCKVSGDHGLAWGLWQTHAPKKKVCSNRKNAAFIALNMMRFSLTTCKKLPLMDRMSVYTDGHCHSHWWRSRFKMERALSWHSTHKLELFWFD